MSIHLELIERVDNGETFYIDFEKRTLRVGKDYLIKDGEYDVNKGLFPELYGNPYSLQVVLHQIRELYRNYKSFKCSLCGFSFVCTHKLFIS